MTYDDTILLIRQNPFNIRQVPYELMEGGREENDSNNGEKLLRFVRRCHGWAVDAWLADLPKDRKAWGKELTKHVWVDIGIVREYEDIM